MRTSGIIVILLFILTSCDPYMVFDQYQKTQNGEWTWDDIKTFEVDMTSNTVLYNVYINIRHTTDYPKSNLYVFVTVTSPEGETMTDTVNIKVTDEHGKWEGNGFGKIKLISRLYRRQVRFRVPGEYTFKIQQGMRLKEVPVTDVGLRIEKYVELK